MEKEIKEITFGAKDSELYKFEYTIPEGYEARIEDGKVIIERKESEDERIREGIVETIRQCTDILDPKNQKRMLDWLERQKEQKPAGWNDTDMNEARNNLISVCRDWEFGKKTTLLPVVAVRARYFLEHLTEPKPAEWSEDEKMKLNRIYAILGQAADTHAFSTTCRLIGDKEAVELQDFLRSIAKPKSLEWSEEDERMRKAVLDEIEHQIEIMPDADDMDSDDQDRYNELISMSVWIQDLPKCMKPSWKPSEDMYKNE